MPKKRDILDEREHSERCMQCKFTTNWLHEVTDGHPYILPGAPNLYDEIAALLKHYKKASGELRPEEAAYISANSGRCHSCLHLDLFHDTGGPNAPYDMECHVCDCTYNFAPITPNVTRTFKLVEIQGEAPKVESSVEEEHTSDDHSPPAT